MEHSAIGASSSERWFNCPGSIPLSFGVEQETSKYAAEGTAAHNLAEMCLNEEQDASDYIGQTVEGFEVTQDMANAVQVYLDTIYKIAGEESEITVEEKFSLDWIDKELFGTNDCCVYDPAMGKLTILDYKHGQGKVVEAEGNTQLLYYALGAARGLYVTVIDLVIVQPRADHPKGPVRSWSVTPEELKEYELTLKDRVADVRKARKANDPYKYTKAGDHCTFCPAAGFCETLRNRAYEVAAVEFTDTPLELPSPEKMDLNQLSKVLTDATLVETWLKSVRQFAHSEADRGIIIPGFKLVKKRSNRAWISEEDAIREFDPLFGDSIYNKKLKSPAQVEKIVGKEEVERLCHKPDTGNTLVPGKDKRPSVTPNAIADFNDI